jgi:hypothetical protein
MNQLFDCSKWMNDDSFCTFLAAVGRLSADSFDFAPEQFDPFSFMSGFMLEDAEFAQAFISKFVGSPTNVSPTLPVGAKPKRAASKTLSQVR